MNFPGRSKRTAMVGEVVPKLEGGGREILAGRVIGLLDGENSLSGQKEIAGFVLQDDSGRVEIAAGALPEVGSVVEVEVETVGNFVQAVSEPVVLAACRDFFIAPKTSPNYQKIIIDQHLKENLLIRGQVIAAIREYFVGQGFVETDTPCLVRLPGMEPYLDVFKTRLEADFSADQKLSEDMYLITSPEYAMKKLLVGGMEKIFQITKSFRNKETFSERHNPEFTILEWYRAFASYLEMMDDTEGLVKFVWQKLVKDKREGPDIMAKWERLRVIDAFAEVGIDEKTFFDLEKFRAAVKERGYAVNDQSSFDDCFFSIFMNEIELKLGMRVPVILYDYPVSMAALSKRCEGDERFAERFEVYIGGLEMCNAFTELNDPDEQERRLRLEKEERAVLGKPIYDVDESFIAALRMGMPPSGGNALGVDRLAMLITGDNDIRNLLYFPHRDL